MPDDFSGIRAVLAGSTDSETEIDHVIIAQIGCAAFLPTKPSVSSDEYPITARREQPDTAEAYQSHAPKIYETVLGALGKSPNVFDLQYPEQEPISFLMPGVVGWLVSRKRFTLRVQMPARLQETFWPNVKPIEDFHVISDGSLFVAFTPVNDYPTRARLGAQYRDLLEKIVADTPLGWVTFGPVPLHPDFYLVIRKRPQDNRPRPPQVYSKQEDVFLVVDGPFGSDIDVLTMFWRSVSWPARQYYRVLLEQNLVVDCTIEILNYFTALAESVRQLRTISAWRFWDLQRLVDSGRESLSMLHTRYVEYEMESFDFARARLRALELMREHEILSKIRSYCEEQTESEFQIPSAMLPAMNHFEAVMRDSFSLWKLLGAGLGTAIIVWILGRLH